MTQFESRSTYDDLLISLKGSHEEIVRELWIMRMLTLHGDYDSAEKRALDLWTFVDLHFRKEQDQLCNILSAKLTFPGSKRVADFDPKKDELVDSLASDHKSLSDSFREIQNITRFSTEWERVSCLDNFEKSVLNYLTRERGAIFAFLVEKVKTRGFTGGREGNNPKRENREDVVFATQ